VRAASPSSQAPPSPAATEAAARCAAHAARRGWTVVATFKDDGYSAFKEVTRDGFGELVAAIEAGRVDVVIVRDIDRLTRNLTDWNAFEKACVRHGVRLSAYTGGDLDLSTAEGAYYGGMETLRARRESGQERPDPGGPGPGGAQGPPGRRGPAVVPDSHLGMVGVRDAPQLVAARDWRTRRRVAVSVSSVGGPVRFRSWSKAPAANVRIVRARWSTIATR
jgi:Resolvase, N terminal domain